LDGSDRPTGDDGSAPSSKRSASVQVALVVLGLAAILAVGVRGLWPQPRHPDRITRKNYERIALGTTRSEVETILGPPGDFTTERTLARDFVGEWSPLAEGPPVVWRSNECEIELGFDQYGSVCCERISDCIVDHVQGIDRMHWQLLRPWHRWFPE
jgi:hypothetical protein